MEDTNIEKCMEILLKVMVEENKKESKELIKDLLDKIKDSKEELSNPETFNWSFMYKLKEGLKELAKTIHGVPTTNIRDTYKPTFIYLNYDFMEKNIRNLCIIRTGHSSCADKSRFILNMYLKYSLTGEIPEFDPNEEHYWIPKFGTYTEWMNLCDGLYKLYYGEPKEYLLSYNELIQSEIRRYKHICHNWFIKFKDGETFRITNTWDDKQNNPLDNEFNNQGNYYLIYKKFVKNRNYEKYDGRDEYYANAYYKVPKEDIEIYKISEEQLL